MEHAINQMMITADEMEYIQGLGVTIEQVAAYSAQLEEQAAKLWGLNTSDMGITVTAIAKSLSEGELSEDVVLEYGEELGLDRIDRLWF